MTMRNTASPRVSREDASWHKRYKKMDSWKQNFTLEMEWESCKHASGVRTDEMLSSMQQNFTKFLFHLWHPDPSMQWRPCIPISISATSSCHYIQCERKVFNVNWEIETWPSRVRVTADLNSSPFLNLRGIITAILVANETPALTPTWPNSNN